VIKRIERVKLKLVQKEISGKGQKTPFGIKVAKNLLPIKNKTLKFACAGTTGYYFTKVHNLFYSKHKPNQKKKKNMKQYSAKSLVMIL
jgi:hypothetical protein